MPALRPRYPNSGENWAKCLFENVIERVFPTSLSPITSGSQISNILAGLSSRPLPSRLLDIGSGDGRVVVATARAGFHSTGVEINPWLVFYSRLRSRSLGLTSQTSFARKDLWKYNLSSFDNVVIFGVEEMMTPLRLKMEAELKTGSRVVACRFPLRDWNPSSTFGEGIDTVWIYDR